MVSFEFKHVIKSLNILVYYKNLEQNMAALLHEFDWPPQCRVMSHWSALPRLNEGTHGPLMRLNEEEFP